MNRKKKEIRDRILRKVLNHEIRQAMAAKMLSISERQIRRLVRTLREDSKSILSPKNSSSAKYNLNGLEILPNDIAIIGMSCRFPDANDYHEFWKNLAAGKNSISRIPADRWDISNYSAETIKSSVTDRMQYGGFLKDIDHFDNQFFNISPREARNMDPQQRLLLEESWRCVENAGIPINDLQKVPTSVFVAVMAMDYYQDMLAPDVITDSYACSGNYACILSNRVSFSLGLSGNSQTIDTACASSLVALHQARQSLNSGESNYALVGGVSLDFNPWKYISFAKAKMLSPDGQCKTFDKDANGYVPGEGVGVLLLQPLVKAIADGNTIHAVIKGSAVNHVGQGRSLNAPRVSAQKEVLTAAYENARINPASMRYFEAHGTGTSLGDPIEIEAITQAFQQYTNEKQFCKIGSVKTNIGHLEAAAGIAGLIKVCLMMRHKTIPKSLNYNTANPIIDFEHSPVTVANCLEPWRETEEGTRCAGVSSFGFGGVNAHVVVEEFRDPFTKDRPRKTHDQLLHRAFILSAKSEQSLRLLIKSWSNYVVNDDFINQDLDLTCKTLMLSRESYPYRFGFCITDRESLADTLNELAKTYNSKLSHRQSGRKSHVIMVIGEINADSDVPQIINQANKDLLFKRNFNRCRKVLKKLAEEIPIALADNGINDPDHKKLVEFCILYSLAKRFLDLGVAPALICGEGQGYLVTMCINGMISLDASLRILLNHSDSTEHLASRPHYPFYDPFSQAIIYPFAIDDHYLNVLTSHLGDIDSLFKRYIKKAQLLVTNQYTFRKYLENWNTALKSHYQTDIYGLLDQKISNHKDRCVVLVLILTSLRQLSKKWNLSEKDPEISPALSELVQLVVNDVIPTKELVDYLKSDEPSSPILSAKIQSKVNSKNIKIDDYVLLSKHNQPLAAIHDLGNRISATSENLLEVVSEEALSDPVFVELGRLSQPMPTNQSVRIVIDETIDYTIANSTLDIWLSGIDLAWSKSLSKTSGSKLPLPVYPFDRRPFWIEHSQPNTVQQSQIVGDNGTVTTNKIDRFTKDSRFHKDDWFTVPIDPNDDLIKDHIIVGRSIIPGALLISCALKSIEKGGGSSVNELGSIRFKRPGVVTSKCNLEIKLNTEGNEFELKMVNDVIANGTYRYFSQGAPEKFIVDSLQFLESISTDNLYTKLHEHGYHYGPGLQLISGIFKDDNHTIFRLAASLENNQSKQFLEASILDGIFQSLLVAADVNPVMNKENVLFVPYTIDCLFTYDALSNNCIVVINTNDIDVLSTHFSGSALVYDENGLPLLKVNHIVFKKVQKDFLVRNKSLPEVYRDAPTFFKPTWIKTQPGTIPKITANAIHLIFLDSNGILGQKLGNTLGKVNADVYYVQQEDSIAEVKRASADTFIIDILQERHLHQMLATVSAGMQQETLELFTYYLSSYEYPAESLDNLNQLRLKQSNGVLALFHIAKMCMQTRFREMTLIVAAKDCFAVNSDDQQSGYAFSSIGGLVKTLRLESRINAKFIDIGVSGKPAISDIILKESKIQDNESIIIYRNGNRFIQSIEPITLSSHPDTRLYRQHGVYLIVGGAGNIGRELSLHLVRQCNTKIVWFGRSDLKQDQLEIINEARTLGSEIIYLSVDISDADQLREKIAYIRDGIGPIQGIFHVAGILEDSLIANKDINSFERVLKSKVYGLWELDRLTRTEPLDFFIVFSSVVSIYGNIGQADYAAANSFLDTFIQWRKQQERPGKSLSINWTLWTDGGMGHSKHIRESFSEQFGLVHSHDALLALDQIISTEFGQLIVTGKSDICPVYNKQSEVNKTNSDLKGDRSDRMDCDLRENVKHELIAMVVEILGVGSEDIDEDTDLREYGLESISLTELTEKLVEAFNIDINPTILFEYPNLNDLCTYLLDNFSDKFEDNYSETKSDKLIEPENDDDLSETYQIEQDVSAFRVIDNDAVIDNTDIAIVGMAGRFPKSKNVNEFWDNLINGRDLITEIPFTRWDWRDYWGNDTDGVNKSISKWGGFIDGIAEFDPEFFNISRREAELMDPQQRLLIECVWHAIEDAGYKASTLSDTQTGVYIGVCNDDYRELMDETVSQVSAFSTTGTYFSIIPNRISYLFDFHGPSVPIDTACSSSLVALHEAVTALIRGDCDSAFVGGVNICLTPKNFISFSQAGMLSPDGRCKTFDKAANGYVRGEGVGVIYLKPLKKAVSDNDHIYGIIKGSAVNHGGFANTLTSPNPNAQADLLLNAYERAGINPETVTYIETHGTGTQLGDPIEINGLKKAFSQLTGSVSENRCGLGAVKTNIGHLESAAGIAGVIKILLAMKHEHLPKTVHFNDLNQNIDLKNSPFYVIANNQEWAILRDENGREIPRRAGVSSFGFGGTNAHVVLEEYVEKGTGVGCQVSGSGKGKPVLIVLSAKTEECLREYTKELLKYVSRHLKPDTSALTDLTYTLHVGREPMEERLAIIATDISELMERLSAVMSGVFLDGFIFRKTVNVSSKDDSGNRIDEYLREKNLSKLASLWVDGLDVNWDLLYKDEDAKRISLPLYPFNHQHYWLPNDVLNMFYNQKKILHPLVDGFVQEESVGEGLVYEKVFRGNEAIISDYKLDVHPILPAAAYLEMALSVCSTKPNINGFQLSDFRWQTPLSIYNSRTVRLKLTADGENRSVNIQCRRGHDQWTRHCDGLIQFANDETKVSLHRVSVKDIRMRMTSHFAKDDVYGHFSENGLQYGPYFQTINDIWYNKTEALGRLIFPAQYLHELNSYHLHPAVIDGALQCTYIFGKYAGEIKLPLSMKSLTLMERLEKECWVYVEHVDTNCYNIALLNNDGNLLVKIRELILCKRTDQLSQFFYQPFWKKEPLVDNQNPEENPTSPLTRQTAKRILIVYPKDDVNIVKSLIDYHSQDEIACICIVENSSSRSVSYQFENTRPEDTSAAPDTLSAPKMYSGIDQCVGQLSLCDHIYFLCGIPAKTIHLHDLDAVELSQECGVISMYKLIRSLTEKEVIGSQSGLTVVTNQVFPVVASERPHPWAASVVGFITVLANEYPELSVYHLDLDFDSENAKLSGKEIRSGIEVIYNEPKFESGNSVAIRNGKRYVRCIEPIQLSRLLKVPFRQKGVYLILGGAGGIGYNISRYLARNVNARLIWVGRRTIDEQVRSQIHEIEALGGRVMYYQADGSDLEAMRNVLVQCKKLFDTIHGVIQSAIVLNDHLIENMEEAALRDVLTPKIKASVVLANIFEDEPLDFLVFFSSLNSFLGSKGQCNYVAGSMFEDALARHLDLARPYPVKVINWGYWGDIGVVATEGYRKRLAEKGIQSIEVEEGIEAFVRIVAHPSSQIIAMKADDSIIQELCGSDSHNNNLSESKSLRVSNMAGMDNHDNYSNIAHFREGIDNLESLGRQLLFSKLQSMGAFLDPEQRYNKDRLKAILQIDQRNYRLFDAVLKIIEKDDFITVEGYQIVMSPRVQGKQNFLNAEDALNDVKQDILREYPEVSAHLEFMWSCLMEYPRLLTGDLTATDIIFPDGKMTLIEDIYKGNLVADKSNEQVSDRIIEIVKNTVAIRSESDPIRILEIGAGTGGTSATVLDHLNDYSKAVHYDYTDISDAFLRIGNTNFGHYSFIEFKELDISQNPMNQGYIQGSYDVIIGANVVHATSDIQHTLRNIKSLLRTDGHIILNEVTSPQDYLTLTFGLLNGWWLFSDSESRLANSPLLNIDMWRRNLSDCGFKATVCQSVDGTDSKLPTQYVILAENDPLVSTEAAGNSVDVVQESDITSPARHTRGRIENHTAADFVDGKIKDCIAGSVKIASSEIRIEKGFSDYGIDSILGIELINDINKSLDIVLSTTALFNYASIGDFRDHILDKFGSDLEVSLEPLMVGTDALFTRSNESKINRPPERSLSDISTSDQSQSVSYSISHRSSTTRMAADDTPVASVGQNLVKSNKSTDKRDLIEQTVVGIIAQSLNLNGDEIDISKGFSDYGIDSILGIEFIKNFNRDFSINLPTTVLFNYATIKDFVSYINQTYADQIRQTLPRSEVVSEPPGGHQGGAQGILIKSPDRIENIVTETIPLKKLGPGDIRIKVKAFSLNFGDLLCVKGLYPTMPEYPFVPGFEVAGVVQELGANVSSLAIGEDVVGVMGKSLGGHSSVAVTDAHFVVRKPHNLSFVEASSLPVIYLTNSLAFKKAQVQEGEIVLIQSAAGGIGLMAIQFALRNGATIIATAGSDEKLTHLRTLGIRHLINYRTEDFFKRAMDITNGKGVDVVINTLSGDAVQKGLNLLAPGGRYIEIAMTGLIAAKAIDLSNLVQNQTFISIDLRRYMLTQPDKFALDLKEMVRNIEAGSIRPIRCWEFPFTDIKTAYDLMDKRQNIGKIVINAESTDAVGNTPSSNLIGREAVITEARQTDKRLQIRDIPSSQQPIAIVGITGRFPGAEGLDEFWQLLLNRESAITEIPHDRWSIAEHYDSDPNQPNKTVCKWGGFLKDIDKFDASFFNIAGKEAQQMDPQHRLFLESVWQTIEDAGYKCSDIANTSTGIFVGLCNNDYIQLMKKYRIDIEAYTSTGLADSLLAHRVSYFFDFHGPSEIVDTACSSAIVAIHRAVNAIQNGECKQAIAGAVNILLTADGFITFSKAGVLSNDGKVRAFDKDANGFVRSDGVGSVFLKPLHQAEKDHDHIYGVIKGSAVNHNGRGYSLTTPNALAQGRVIEMACKNAEIDPATIDYIETQGTGTKIGDPIEVSALHTAFENLTKNLGTEAAEINSCGIGSVKPNIGHLEAASGMAALAKILLGFKYETIPATINFNQLNSHIDLKNSPFYVLNEQKVWATKHDRSGLPIPRRAGLNSFGFAGGNAHIILEEYLDKRPPKKSPESTLLFIFSAKNSDRLHTIVLRMKLYVLANPTCCLVDVAFTLQIGRENMAKRLAIVADAHEQLLESLEHYLNGEFTTLIVNDDSASDGVTQNIGERAIDLGQLIIDRDLNGLAHHWVQGVDIDWYQLHQHDQHYRVSLPVYPFSGERFWFANDSLETQNRNEFELTHRHFNREHEDKIQTEITEESGAINLDEVIKTQLIVKTEEFLKNLFSREADVPISEMKVTLPLQDYGISSLIIKRCNIALESFFGPLPKTMFYEYQNLQGLARYFVDKHTETLLKEFKMTNIQSRSSAVSTNDTLRESNRKDHQGQSITVQSSPVRDEPIAIIGMSGRYPQALDLNTFWENLKAGKDCISTINPDHWRGAINGGNGNGVLGGFLDDIDKFDPLFFNISPRDAELMDPQERLFLQAAWEVLEDAGYSTTYLTQTRSDRQSQNNVGVFVGVMYSQYQLLSDTAMSYLFSIPNRVSYTFNFSGPSLAIDTACSSSLTAINLACESLHSGASQLAIAGGVNLSLHPLKYKHLADRYFLSSDGRCRSFGEGGDGFVPSEGVGAILLKPLSRAMTDRDHIYGVIKGYSLNHGGKTNGFTVPNPIAQAALIREALIKSGINPESLTYIEAHGTGTELGDPIEIRGLAEAFSREIRLDAHFCAVGSVKSNIGHLEAAAGIAGVSKVLLQLKHRQLVPTLHTSQLNPNIDFEHTLFRVQRQLEEWKRPRIGGQEFPLLAGVSSFGAGGANAHVIIEEYVPIIPQRKHIKFDNSRPVIISLSAKDADRLEEMVKQLLTYIKGSGLSDDQLMNMAYTLHLGREQFEERLAVMVTSMQDLQDKLARYLDVKVSFSDLYLGRVDKNYEAIKMFTSEGDIKDAIDKWIIKGNTRRLAELWTNGLDIDWTVLYADIEPCRLSLPTYPFAKERYWVNESENISVPSLGVDSNAAETCRLQPSVPVVSEQFRELSNKWLFLEEKRIETPLIRSLNWNQLIEGYAGQTVLIIHDDLSDRDELITLLHNLETAAQFSDSDKFQIQSVSTTNLKNQFPETVADIILFVGSNIRSSEYSESKNGDIKLVFYLTQMLMKRACDQKVSVYYLFDGEVNCPKIECEALSGFFKSAAAENPLHRYKLISRYDAPASLSSSQILIREWLNDGSVDSKPMQVECVGYEGETRFIPKLREIIVDPPENAGFREGTSYLIVGGLGPVGELLCRELSERYHNTLVIFSRAPLDEEKKAQCEKIEALGGKVHYYSVDITDRQELEQTYERIKQDVGAIHGVIHLARLVEDGLIVNKSYESFQRVIGAKVQGTVNLDEILKSEPLEFFLLFSSMAAYGIRGSCDYGYSCAFQNAFAIDRERRCKLGLRRGTTISLCWGAWEVDKYQPQNRDEKAKIAGFDLIDIQSAFTALAAILSSPPSAIWILAMGDKIKLRQMMGVGTGLNKSNKSLLVTEEVKTLSDRSNQSTIEGLKIFRDLTEDDILNMDDNAIELMYQALNPNITDVSPKFTMNTENTPQVAPDNADGSEEPDINSLVRDNLAAVLKLDINKIDDHEPIQNYGLDSITGVKITTLLERILKIDVKPQWLIDYPSVDGFSRKLGMMVDRGQVSGFGCQDSYHRDH